MASSARKHLAVVPSSAPPPTRPEGPQNARYKHFVRSFLEFKHLGSRYDVKAMHVLLDFERTSICWKTSPQMRFEDILRDERFCTVARFKAFKRAVETFRRDQIERLGVEVVCIIVRQPSRFHPKLLRAALTFRTTHDVAPTYQHMSRLINLTVPRKTGRPTYAQLRRQCEELKSQLKAIKRERKEQAEA